MNIRQIIDLCHTNTIFETIPVEVELKAIVYDSNQSIYVVDLGTPESRGNTVAVIMTR